MISQKLPQRFDRDQMAAWAARHPEIRPGPRAGLQNMLVARLSWGGATNGLLVMTALNADAFDDSHVELAAQIADQISGAISNAGSHEAALQAEEERHASEARESELQALNEQRSNFLSTVSHELKTPLTSLLAFADLLARNRGTNLSERQLQQINVMQRSARRLDVLINDLLDVSKLDAGTFSLSKSEFDVEALLEEIAASFAPIVQQKRQKLNIVHGPDPFWLCSDRDRVAQVVINLLSNASKYSGEESVITLGTFAANGKLTFTIKDAGIGMSKEDQKRLFTPFFRASDDATQAEPGSGLGLVIVKSIVELHGGEISLESEPGVGTTVSVTFADCSDGPSEAHLESERAAAEPIIPHSRLDEIPVNTLGD